MGGPKNRCFFCERSLWTCSFRKFSMNSGSTKDRHVTPSENAVYLVSRWWNIGKKYWFPHHNLWFIRLWLIFYPLSSSIIILNPTVIQFWLGVIWFQANLERYARQTELVGGWTNPFEKYAGQIGSFPRNRGENKKCLKPPPSWKSSPTIRLLKAHHAATPHAFRFCWKQRLRRCANKRCNLKQESRV